jgi:N-acetylglucosaminyl-diphospho-decaprenol L-rhamnosyltransferase
MPTLLTVVIVHYNTPALLRGCLRSLRDCTVPLQVVVVDNGSPDRAVEALSGEFPEVRFILNQENRGYAAANNQGMRLQTSPLPPGGREVGSDLPPAMLLLNPDTVVQPGTLERLVAFMEDHPRVGAVGPRLLNPDGSLQENAFRFPTLFMSFFDFFPLHGRLYHSRLNGRFPEMRGDRPFPIDHPLGACLLLRGAALQEVGLLDEGYFMYVEEVDLCYRLKQAGWDVWHLPTACVVHYGGQSTKQVSARMLVELHRSRYRFFHKYYPAAFSFLHRQITRLGLWWRGRQDRKACAQGQLPREQLAERLAAYGEIAAMR